MTKRPPCTPWRRVVALRDDVRTGELSLADFAADLHDVMMQRGARPVYEDPARFFALTYPTFALRELARDVVLRLAGRNTKAIRQLELTYGGGKTHTLVALRHLAHDPEALPALPAVEQFRSHAGAALPRARVAALAFDKLDVEKGMEVRGPAGESRWLKHPWSVLAFQLAGEDGLRALHPEDRAAERETAPAEPLLAGLLARPRAEGLATLVLIDEVLMFARGKVAVDEAWRGRLIDFFQYLCQAAARVDRCALVASLLASDPAKHDDEGKVLSAQIAEIFNRQKEEGVQPVQKDDVSEVLRRRFFTPASIADPALFLPHVTAVVANLAAVDDAVRKDRKAVEDRFNRAYPFHPDLTDVFYTRWTQLDRFQRTRGILRTFAVALRDAEPWDPSPLVGPSVFLPAPGRPGIAEAARELTGIATREVAERGGHDWAAILEGELEKARAVERELPGLAGREPEQAVCAVFLSSQPIGQKALTPDLIRLIGAARPDRIALEHGLRRWTELSWFLDDAEFAPDAADGAGPAPLPKAWRLGNRPNLRQMHDDACANRVTADAVEARLLAEVRSAKSLTQGAKAAGARVHLLPDRPRDVEDDGEFHFVVLGPRAVAESGRPGREARRFLDETTAPDRPRVRRNAVVLAAPSRDGLEMARRAVRVWLGWEEVRAQLEGQPQDPVREEMLATWTAQARRQMPDAVRQAWTIVVTVNADDAVHAFKVTPAGSDPLFATIAADRRARMPQTAINAEALLPGGPYDLWRADEPARRVKDLAGAFAEQSRLPKMLRRQEILDTIDRGVRDGLFVAALARPDGSVRTWWRTPLDEAVRQEPALEVVLPAAATLSALDPAVVSPGVLPGLWSGGAVTVGGVVDYFAGGRTVTAARDGYEETVCVPACPADAVEAAIAEAVGRGGLWLLHGPASFQGEPLPAGVLTGAAELRPPLPPLPVERLMPEAAPGAWTGRTTTAVALAAALAAQEGRPLPWTALRRAIDDAVASRWLEAAPGGGPWPCDAAGAAQVTLRRPDAFRPVSVAERPEAYTSSATLDPAALQDLVEVLPAVVKAAAGVPLAFRLDVTLGEEQAVDAETVAAVDALLQDVSRDLRLKRPSRAPRSMTASRDDAGEGP